jgi:ubiquinone/menaquinone biosynthesis C-methylase UbiE
MSINKLNNNIMIHDEFEMEEIRNHFATENKVDLFKATYSSKYPEIRDLNTPKYWDNYNNRPHIDNLTFPMNYHKLKIVSNLIPNKKINLLNVGCGSGDLENVVFKRKGRNSFNWYGLDISLKSIATCRREFSEAVFDVGDIRNLKYEKNFFDVVILMEILEHIAPKDLFKSLSEVNKVMKKNGLLIVTIPINEGLKRLIETNNNRNAHVRIYTKSVICQELKLSGFKVDKVHFFYAFPRLYKLKSFIVKHLLPKLRMPNNLLVIATKK